MEGIELNFVGVSHYLGSYLGLLEELEAWVQPQVEAWDHGVRNLREISKRQPQSSNSGLGILFQIKWQYLKTTFHGV